MENEKIMRELPFGCIFKKKPKRDECRPSSICVFWGIEKREA